MTMDSQASFHIHTWSWETGAPFTIVAKSLADLGITDTSICGEHVADFEALVAKGQWHVDTRLQYAILNDRATLWGVKDAYWGDYVAWCAKHQKPVPSKDDSMLLSTTIWGSYLFPPRRSRPSLTD